MQVVDFNLPMKISTNKIYAGEHWTVRKKQKDLFLWNFIEIATKIRPVVKCEIEMNFKFKSKPLDCDNCVYMAKLIIDCLRHYDKIKDDNPNIVPSLKITSEKGESDCVKITLNDDIK